TFLLRSFSQSGSVSMAACLNTLVGATAYLCARGMSKNATSASNTEKTPSTGAPEVRLGFAMVLAGLSGCIALGYEIAWFRVYAIVSADRAPAFALLLATYLAGVAAGS